MNELKNLKRTPQNKGQIRKARQKERLKKSRPRIVISTGIIFSIIALLVIRLGYIMIVKSPEYSGMAEEQWTNEIKIQPVRGKILDRNGKELAVSADVYRVDIDLNSLKAYLNKTASSLTKDEKAKRQEKGIPLPTENEGISMDSIIPIIAAAAEMDEEEVKDILNTTTDSGLPASSATLIRRIEKEKADKIKDLGISGIIVARDTKRIYPNNNFLSQTLGVTNSDGTGLTGIEAQYNTYLSGVAGIRIGECDKNNSVLPYGDTKATEAIDGKNVTLTIDETIQSIAEKVAQKAYEDNNAKATSVLIMDPKTGEVLAMANKPDFNPNEQYTGYEDFDGMTNDEKIQKMWRNRLVSDSFEPGSIFKVMTALAAMEEGVVDKDTTFNCTGSRTYNGSKINCWQEAGHGEETFPEIIQNSCNVGFMDVGEMLGKDRLSDYINKFGFGQLTGIDLPGETQGIVKNPEDISETDLATISFGHTNTLNSFQYMAAFNAVANGGTWIQPHIMKEITHSDSNGIKVVDDKFAPQTKEIASNDTTAELRTYLEKVVTSGSATAAFIDGYHIGGKTGTAAKMENGVYVAGKYISSFVAMAPVDDPKITMMITVDEPGNGDYYAGQVAVPYGRMVFTELFNYLNNQFSAEGTEKITKDVIVPEVRGMEKDKAEELLKKKNIKCEVEGNGNKIEKMDPYPGSTVKEDTTIKISTSGGDEDASKVVMPNLQGYSREDAASILQSLGISAEFTGDGVVSRQSIASGEIIKKGISVKITLSKGYKD